VYKRFVIHLLLLIWIGLGIHSGIGQQLQTTELLSKTLFTDPAKISMGQADRTLLNQIRDLIEITPEDEEITICIFKFDDQEILESLISAKERGVKVRIILNNGETSEKVNERIKGTLKKEIEDFYYIENEITKKAIIHNKFILFSRIEAPSGSISHVILQTSSNFQQKSTEKLQDMLLIKDKYLYFSYLDFWYDIKVFGKINMLESYNYFDMQNADKNIKAFFLPKRRDEEEYGNDIIIKILDEIREPKNTRIKLAHGKWKKERDEVIDKLKDLVKDGAQVEIVTNHDLDEDVRDELNKTKASIKYLDSKTNLHTKFFLIDGEFKNGNRKIVYTGSHNLTERSLRDNFEVLVEVIDQQIYREYLAYFNQIMELD